MMDMAISMLSQTETPGMLNWTEFLAFMKAYRGLEVDLFNARAGFSKEEVENYKETFEEYDKSGDGELSLKELVPVLTALGHEPRTVIQRAKLTAILAEVDADGSGEIGFDEFLQPMRKFIDQSMAEQLLKERDIIGKTRFDADEVAQWREIFLKFDADNSGAFDTDEAMDFPEFLLMMRRLLDLDFGGIATRMGIKDHDNDEKSVAEKKKEERAERRKSRAPGK